MKQSICNICGANYEYHNGRWKCPACGAFKAEELSNEEATLLYNAAQKLRFCDFDEAEKAFTDIIEKYPQNPNGYWGRLLSRYGIKYEEDFDGRKIPTCYATSIESVISDKDFIKAIEFADNDTKVYFEQQAQYIERVRKEWVEKAKKEKPYDIFICYKDSDLANGIDRTQDSIAAQELYIHLTEQGYRVFFSRESLRGKVGEKYEPYIFNALSTAKVMLVYGSKSEYITSTWLKNEWTRYEKRLQAGEKKPNSLIVACDGFSPNELPKVLSSMQCFDATSRSFYTDLDAVLKKIIKGEEKPKPVAEPKPEKKKSKKLPIAIASIATVIAIFLCILLPNVLGNKPSATITDSKYGVVISADSEIFDKNTSVIVDKLTDGAQYTALVSTVSNSKSVEIKNAIVYDIECDVDITKNVTIKVAYSKSSADATVKVYYVSDDKSLIEEHSCIYDDGFVEFKTNHLSYYVIGEIVSPSNPGGNDNPGGNENAPATPSLTYEEGVLQVGVSANYEPYEYLDDGQFKGIEIDILKAIAAELELEIRFENDIFEDLLGNLNAKEVDCIIGVTETAQRNEFATATNALFSEDDMEFIIYLNKDCNDLRVAINTAITKLKDNGTIDSIIESYSTPELPTTTTVIFNANGGSGTMTEQVVLFGTSFNLPKCTFTRDGYIFTGWATSENGTVAYADQASYSSGNELTYTLYAVWTKEKFTITFNGNGGTGSIDAIEFEKNQSIETPFNTFVRAGYEFVGWSLTPDGQADYIEGATYAFDASKVLYAIWREITPEDVLYTVKHYLQTPDGTGYSLDSTQELYALPGTLVSPSTNFYEGFSSPAVQSKTITENGLVEIKYYYTRQSYTISFVTNGGTEVESITQLYGSNINSLPTSVKDNLTFSSWYTDETLSQKFTSTTMPSENTVLFAKWKEEALVSDFTIEQDGNITLIKYNGSNKECTIPSHFGGVPITAIADNCFADNTTIESVFIPKTITIIGTKAFANCSKLARINSDNSGTIIVPDRVTTINDFAFQGLTQIIEVRIPNNVNYIGNGVLNGCTSIKILSIPFVGSKKGIEGCLDANEPVVPYNGTLEMSKEQYTNKLGHIFGYAGDLSSTYRDDDMVVQGEYRKWVGSIGNTNLVYYGFCFYIPSSLEQVIVTNQDEIPAYAFENCSNLKSIVYPNGLTKIGAEALSNCKALTAFEIEKSVNYVGSNAFSMCNNLTIYAEFANFEEAASTGNWSEYWNTTGVDVVWGFIKQGNKVSFDYCGATANNTIEYKYVESGKSYTFPIPSKTGYTFGGWYYGTTQITGANGITITSWNINSHCTLIAKWTPAPSTIILNANGGTVESETVSIEYGSNYTIAPAKRPGYIFLGWFGGTESNANVYTDGNGNSLAVWNKAEGATFYAQWQVDYSEGLSYTKLEGYLNAKKVYAYEVSGIGTCTDTIIKIPSEIEGICVVGIGSNAFSGNTNITSVIFPEDYLDNDGIREFFARTAGFSSNGLYIKYKAFFNCTNLQSVTLNKVSDIGGNAFSNCSKLYSVEISAATPLKKIDTYAFSDCKALTTFVIPEECTTLGEFVFSGCTSLTVFCEAASKPDGWRDRWNNTECTVYWGYLRNGYLVDFDYDGANGNNSVTYRFVEDGNTYILPIPSKTGYTFGGWYYGTTQITNANGVTLSTWDISSDCTLTAKWDPNENTAYMVKHYQENANDTGYTLKDTETLYGTTDSSVSPNTKTYIGFNAPSKASVKILPDGSAVLEYHYIRTTNTITFVTNGGDTIDTMTVKYQQTVTIPDAAREGFTFGGWFADADLSDQFTQTSVSSNTTLYAWWTEETKPSVLSYSGSSVVTVSGYTGNETYVRIPSYIDGNLVTTISSNAFENKSNLKTIYIPNTVTTIGMGAFKGCNSVEEITLPFVGCTATSTSHYAVFGYIFGCSNTGENGGSSINQSNTFRNETYGSAIEGAVWQYSCGDYSVYQPTWGVTYYYNTSYYYYIPTSIRSVTITSQTEIPIAAFNGCDFIETITLPANVTSIGDYAFQDCKAITEMNSGNALVSIGGYAFSGCVGLEKLTLPVTTEIIGSYACNGCVSLNKINSVTSGEIVIPEKVKTIGAYAFRDCTLITKVNLGTVNVIGEQAFAGCSGLMEIFGGQLNEIGASAFQGCSKITKFNSNSMNVLNIPNGTISIGQYAFKDVSSINRVVIPNTVTTVGMGAFKGCNSLEEITLPFVGCTATSTSHYAVFGYIFGCSDTGKNGIGSSYSSNTFRNETYGSAIEGAVWQYSCEDFYVRNSTYGVNEYYYTSYYYYIPTSIRSVTITSQTEIPIAAFNGCDFIETITLPLNATSIGNGAFQNCKAITEMNLEGALTSIGSYAFGGCSSLTNISLSNFVTTIKFDAFIDCISLVAIHYEGSASNWSAVEKGTDWDKNTSDYSILCFDGTIYKNGAFVEKASEGLVFVKTEDEYILSGIGTCTDTNIFIPSKYNGYPVTKIGEAAFEACENIESVYIHNGIIEIGKRAFNACTNLETVILPATLVFIDDDAFRMTGIKEITIPSSVREMGWYVFEHCQLTSVTFENSDNWWYTDEINATSGTSISTESLSNTSTAALYLKSYSYYAKYYWRRDS